MNIDRSNYQIWLIDWLDGNLNSHQIEQLQIYLEQNPDIKEEFNELAQIKLLPERTLFRHKENLKKSPSDFALSQFEYLCTAYLENDLTDSQQAELLDIVSRYPDRKKTFDLIQKSILPQERIEYRYKNLLLKRTPFQKGMRLTLTGLMTAAAIFIVIILFHGINHPTPLELNTSAHNFVPDSTQQRSPSAVAAVRIRKENLSNPVEEISESMAVSTNKKDNAIVIKNIPAPLDDSNKRIPENQKIEVIKVPVNSQVNLGKGITRETLIASDHPNHIPDTDNERSKAGKFLSKTFREKFLKEKTPPDTPLKGYEIAEAGVTGLNKLFGWKMVLVMKNDDQGEPNSVYFSSTLLKLNAPVKKKESQP